MEKSKTLIIVLILLFSTSLWPVAKAGALGCAVCCYSSCGVAAAGCSLTAMAPPVFIACVAAACGAYASTICLVPCTAGCFSPETTFEVSGVGLVSAETVASGDLVRTLSGNQLSWTRVTYVQRHKGPFDAVELVTSAGSKLTLTKDHILAVLVDGSLMAQDSSSIQPGDQLINKLGNTETVVQVTNVKIATKIEVNTDSGSLFASSLLATTMCGNSVQTPMDLSEALSHWRKQHSAFD